MYDEIESPGGAALTAFTRSSPSWLIACRGSSLFLPCRMNQLENYVLEPCDFPTPRLWATTRGKTEADLLEITTPHLPSRQLCLPVLRAFPVDKLVSRFLIN